MLRSLHRNRPLLHVPTPLVSRGLRLLEATLGQRAFATWDEAELMEVPMLSARGTGRRGASRGSRPNRWAPCCPRHSLFQLRGKRQQRRLAGRAPDELHAQRQAVLALEQRQRDRGLAGWR